MVVWWWLSGDEGVEEHAYSPNLSPTPTLASHTRRPTSISSTEPKPPLMAADRAGEMLSRLMLAELGGAMTCALVAALQRCGGLQYGVLVVGGSSLHAADVAKR
mgnify:CR=1 FL=1